MIVIRACKGLEELQACVDLETEVWGYNDGDVIPRRAFLVAQKIGGQVIGAFDTSLPGAPEQGNAGSMVGFAFSWPGVKTGAESRTGEPEIYLHSHMLAVRESYRNQRIGRQLKLVQREEALGRGIRRMEWTFDPLEIKNAFLNISKLGAVIRRYEENFYGVSSSRLQGGLPTDRLVAEWWLDSERVKAAVAGVAPSSVDGDAREIVVPAAVYGWKAYDVERHKAEAVQTENRERFLKAFGEGLAVVAFTRDLDGNGTYRLGRWSDPGTA
jgi:predicted GNAT superfamily acetyltransferase